MAQQDWTTRVEPPVAARPETHTTTYRGLEVKVERSYGLVMTSVRGWIGGRRVHVYEMPTARGTSDLKADAIALADSLLAAGFTGQPEPVSAVAGLTPDEGDHLVFPAAGAS